MSKKNKLTPNQDKYKELQKRLKRKLRDVKKRGYEPNRAIKEEWLGTEIPKTVRKSELKKIEEATKNIYQYTKYYNPLKDEYIIGTERRKQERSEASRKAWETRRENILRSKDEIDRFWYEFDEEFSVPTSLPSEEELTLQQLESLVNNWTPQSEWADYFAELLRQDRDTVKSILDGAIDTLGRTQVAKNCAEHATELLSIINEILYYIGTKYTAPSFESGNSKIQRVKDILYGRPSTVRESMELTRQSEILNESE